MRSANRLNPPPRSGVTLTSITARTAAAAAASRERSSTGRQPRKIFSFFNCSSCWLTAASDSPATLAISPVVRLPPSIKSLRTEFIDPPVIPKRQRIDEEENTYAAKFAVQRRMQTTLNCLGAWVVVKQEA